MSALITPAALNGARERDEHRALPLTPEHVAAALRAVRAAEISLSTGIWIADDRLDLIAGRTERPELVSIDLSEPGWEELAALVTGLGIGIEAGSGSAFDAEALVGSALRPARVLVEIDDEGLQPEAAVAAAASIDAALGDHDAPRLHHGMGPATWAVIDAARPLGHDVRIGLEDVLTLRDGEPAAGNAELVARAFVRTAP